jgi:uncharacterized lipoprotein NlpE involved in copper resistance
MSQREMYKKTTTPIILLIGCLTLLGCDNKVSDPTLKGMLSAKRDQLTRLVQMANEDRHVTRTDIGSDNAASAGDQ